MKEERKEPHCKKQKEYRQKQSLLHRTHKDTSTKRSKKKHRTQPQAKVILQAKFFAAKEKSEYRQARHKKKDRPQKKGTVDLL